MADEEDDYPCKRMFLEESIVEGDLKTEGEGNLMMDLGDIRDFLRTDIPRLLPTPCESSAQHRALLKEEVDEVVAKVCSALEKSTLADVDADTLSSDIRSTTITAEAVDDDHVPNERIINRRRGHCSLNLDEIPPHANAFTGALPGNRGHRSAPPNLDATWTLTSHVEFFPSVSDFAAEDLNGLTEDWFYWHCLNSYSESEI